MFRLGPFGFFYQDTGDEEAALGNFGIWDQIEALTWVKKHIKDFGGDPYQVSKAVEGLSAKVVIDKWL